MTSRRMLGIVSRAALEVYERTVERLASTWSDAWRRICVADDKCRAEHLTRVRRRVMQSVSAGGVRPPDRDPTAPWPTCSREAALDANF